MKRVVYPAPKPLTPTQRRNYVDIRDYAGADYTEKLFAATAATTAGTIFCPQGNYQFGDMVASTTVLNGKNSVCLLGEGGTYFYGIGFLPPAPGPQWIGFDTCSGCVIENIHFILPEKFSFTDSNMKIKDCVFENNLTVITSGGIVEISGCSFNNSHGIIVDDTSTGVLLLQYNTLFGGGLITDDGNISTQHSNLSI